MPEDRAKPKPNKSKSTPQPPDYATLVAAAQRNLDTYFDPLYKASWPSAYYIALSYTSGNTHDAEDIAQTAFVKVYNNLHTLKNPQDYKVWLNRIVANTAKDELRSKSRRPQPHAQENGMENLIEQNQNASGYAPSAPVSHPQTSGTLANNQEQMVETKELHALLLGIVHELPPKSREALLLYYYADLSSREIAESLGISENAVTIRLSRARENLRDRIHSFQRIHIDDLALAALPLMLKSLDNVGLKPLLAAPKPPPFIPPKLGGSASKPENTLKSKSLTRKQWTAIGASAVAVVLVAGIATYTFLKPTPSQPQDSPVILSGARSAESNSSDAKRSAEPAQAGDLASDNEGQPPALRADETPNETPTAPSSNDSGPSNAAPAAKKPTAKPATTPAKKSPASAPKTKPATTPAKESPASAPNTIPTPPQSTSSLPTVSSYLCFGSLSGTHTSWKVTAKSGSTLTLIATHDRSLEGLFTSAERAAILNTSAGAKPTITIDATKLNFTFNGSCLHADSK